MPSDHDWQKSVLYYQLWHMRFIDSIHEIEEKRNLFFHSKEESIQHYKISEF